MAWLRGTCGACRFCRRGAENLCPASVYTGWDAHGGYAEYALAVDAYTYALPAELDDVRAAPLLCAGIIGYRALRRAALPPGGRLGIWGFGGSAHLAAQIAVAEGADVHVFTRSPAARELARDLGASWAGDSFDAGPAPLDSAIVFAPGGGAGRGGAGTPRPRRDVRDRRDPSERRPVLGLPAVSVPGAAGPLGDGEHAGGRRGVPQARGAPGRRRHDARLRAGRGGPGLGRPGGGPLHRRGRARPVDRLV
ncbi:alcohol dehydrogenase catalytic domain-containing protein [Actinomadura madurae]|uniref:alcohol dehydrogenase catalytic domain-containing protein n=1 Tax=Actinomadura madurae TaxID=1993 RepID=UPI0027E370E9|nr:alcohol dehydrogenase catalytic domain-containing protein [Actinomadura madurae]